MKKIRVISGTLKGKIIPFSNQKFNDADITSQKVKGALFSSIGEELYNKSFLDLYAGSGQIGIEALSRGAEPVIINEIDPKRYKFIRQYFQQININCKPNLLHYDALYALKYLSKNNIKIDYLYLDPPYSKIKDEALEYDNLLMNIDKFGILNVTGLVIIQHFSKNFLDSTIGKFICKDKKKYGNTTLTFMAYS